MTLMEVYLLAIGIGNLFVGGYALGLARKLEQQRSGMDQAVAGNIVEIETCIHLTQKSLLELHQIAVRQAEEIADLRTRVIALSKKEGK